MLPTSFNVAAPATSGAYGAPIYAGGATFAGGSVSQSNLMREVVIGVVIAVVAGMVLKHLKG